MTVETIAGIPYKLYAKRPRRIESLLDHAERWGERAHLVQGDRRISFAWLRSACDAKVEELSAAGARPGDRIFLLGWNSADWIVAFWASLRLGAVPVLANAWWSTAELAGAIDRLQPTVCLADKASASKLPASVARCAWDAAPGPSPNSGAAVEPISNDENAPAVVLFTSGTSGTPKAVELSHRALLAGLHMLLHITRRLPHQVDNDTGETSLHTGPLFHIGGVQSLLRSAMVGDTLVMPRSKYDPGEALELIEANRISRWSAVPTMVTRLLDHPDLKTRDVASLRSLTIGGAPVHAELLARIASELPSVNARVPTGYGLTENGGQATAASGADTSAHPGNSGRPLPCVELKFEPKPGFPDGEILIRAPTQMNRYIDSDTSPIDADGWLETGDLGRLDEEGLLWITGRCKEMIIRGGENIAPAAIEGALQSISGVADAAVIGIPHADLGEEVMAFVVVDRPIDAAELTVALKAKISSFAIPGRWEIQTDPLPTNHTGKIDKPALASRALSPIATA